MLRPRNRSRSRGGRSRGALKPRKKRVSRLGENGVVFVDFRDTKLLVRYLSEQGRIVPRRTSGNNAQQQKQLAMAIKRARHLALLPFVSDIQR